jgi:prophage antirepressor-like protein
VRVIEDEGHQRWIRAADVRRIAGSQDSDHALQLTYGTGYRLADQPPEGYFSETALLAHLARQADPAAARLRLWVERVVVWPAREQRRRLGLPAPTPEDGPQPPS